MLKIRIIGFCQAQGISEAVKLLLPNQDVAILALKTADNAPFFDSEISNTDVLLSADGITESMFAELNPNALVLRWPQLYFPAFHPDIALASSFSHTITSMGGCPYNSTICLWSWLNNLPVNLACKLFNIHVYKSLGYLDCWSLSATKLSNDFKKCDLDFNIFFNAVKRGGVFMHSDSHAKAYPIILIAKQLVQKIGVPHIDLNEPIESYLPDTLLFDTVWPVYTEIADVLGVKGSYIWKYRNTYFHNLENYIFESYSGYENQPIDRSVIASAQINDTSNKILQHFARTLA
jgi:hypothetical protein